MVRNNLYWSDHIRRVFIPLIDAFSDCLKKRVLPSFDKLEQEADQVANETWNRLGSHATENTDPADLADSAFQKGLEFYQTMTEMIQGIRNLFAVGLYHLFEQQVLYFHRSELLDFGEENDPKLFKTKEAFERLAAHGIAIDQFRSWDKVRELQTLANAIKHADGPSCEALKELRPDLFCHPDARDLGPTYLPGVKVFQPLGGEAIYVTDEAFDGYVAAAKEFWNELAAVLERQAG